MPRDFEDIGDIALYPVVSGALHALCIVSFTPEDPNMLPQQVFSFAIETETPSGSEGTAA